MTFAAFWMRAFDCALGLGPCVTLTPEQSDRIVQELVSSPPFLTALKDEMEQARDQVIDTDDAADLARWFARKA